MKLTCCRIGRKKTTVLGVVVSFIASVIAVVFQRDLKNTGNLLENLFTNHNNVITPYHSHKFLGLTPFPHPSCPSCITGLQIPTFLFASEKNVFGRVFSISWLMKIWTFEPNENIFTYCYVCRFERKDRRFGGRGLLMTSALASLVISRN